MQLLKKKKKKKQFKNILELDGGVDEKPEQLARMLEIKVLRAFKGHVGEAKAINPRDLFVKVFGIKPEYMNLYKREYWWRVVLKMLQKFRSRKRLFVINRGKHLFVLKTRDEADEFRARVDKTISALEKVQDKADDWVKEKKWKEFEGDL